MEKLKEDKAEAEAKMKDALKKKNKKKLQPKIEKPAVSTAEKLAHPKHLTKAQIDQAKAIADDARASHVESKGKMEIAQGVINAKKLRKQQQEEAFNKRIKNAAKDEELHRDQKHKFAKKEEKHKKVADKMHEAAKKSEA